MVEGEMIIQHLVTLYQCDICRNIVPNLDTTYHSKTTGLDYCESCYRLHEKEKEDRS